MATDVVILLATGLPSFTTQLLHNHRHIFNNCSSVCTNSAVRIFRDFLSQCGIYVTFL